MKQLEKIVQAIESNEEFVITTIVETQGSTPGRVGFSMIVYPDKTAGTVGGGALEISIVSEARDMLLQKKEAQLKKINLTELDMNCGGMVQVFFESYYKKPSLWIFGAGHIAKALAPLIANIGFRITIVDNRDGFAVKENFPSGTVLMTKEYAEALKEIQPGAYAVIVTHGHAYDGQILRALASFQPPLPYIGMIGSRKKVLGVLSTLASDGIKNFDHIYAPIGLNIGGDSPEEIAISIAAEIQGIYNKKTNLPHCRIDQDEKKL